MNNIQKICNPTKKQMDEMKLIGYKLIAVIKDTYYFEFY